MTSTKAVSIFERTLDKTLNEGIALAQEARNYIAFHETSDRREFPLEHCLYLGYQQTRVSARLIQSMTWLLAMKALMLKEISVIQFLAPQYEISDSEECTSNIGENDANIPEGLQELLVRSHSLFSRIQRLNMMVHEKLIE